MNNIQLTVVIPTYNRDERLNSSLKNYLISKRNDIEFLVVDNDSKDNTEAVVKQLMESDSRIRYMKNQVNVGVSRSTFLGFMEVSSPLVMILCDDDFITEGFLDLVINKFDQYPNVGVVHSCQNSDERIGIGKTLSDNGILYPKGIKALREAYVRSGGLPGIAFRSDTIDHNAWILDNSIYPAIDLASDIALRHDVFMIYSETEYLTVGRLDDVIEKSLTRPDDMGIHERIHIASEVTSRLPANQQSFAYHHITLALLRWSLETFFEFYQTNHSTAMTYLKATKNHPRIKSSLIFWGIFLKGMLQNSQVRIIDKLRITTMALTAMTCSVFKPGLYQSLGYILKRIFKKNH